MGNRLLLGAAVLLIGAALLLGGLGVATGRIASVGMMGGWRAVVPGAGNVSMSQAQAQVQAYLDRTGNQDLKIDELLEFDQNFYALIKERSTGTGAFELLVNRQTGVVTPEPGPNMMWNAKYSPMARGMMGGAVRPSGAMTVSPDRATQIAQEWLDRRYSGYAAGTPDAFYGYYTFHFEKDGGVAGMLSVNGQSGAVWLHTWHGSFISAREVG